MIAGREFCLPGFSGYDRKHLTHKVFRSIFIAIFRKGALLMNMYGFVSMMSADTENHVRTIVVYDRKFREA